MARRKMMDDKIPAFTAADLKRGIDKFQSRKNWPKDLHAEFYQWLAGQQKSGLTQEWWKSMVPVLRRWLASRGKTDDYIRCRGKARLGKLQNACDRVSNKVKKSGLELRTCKWEDVAGLFDVAYEIKETKGGSAVFASKLCHFIAPSAFPVIDNEALGFSNPNADDYREYWECLHDRWHDCDHDALIEILRPYTKGGQGGYPWATKIAELCAMGRKG